jgi:hypothetical protein
MHAISKATVLPVEMCVARGQWWLCGGEDATGAGELGAPRGSGDIPAQQLRLLVGEYCAGSGSSGEQEQEQEQRDSMWQPRWAFQGVRVGYGLANQVGQGRGQGNGMCNAVSVWRDAAAVHYRTPGAGAIAR